MTKTHQPALALNGEASAKELTVISKAWEILDPEIGSLSTYVRMTVEYRQDMLSPANIERLKADAGEFVWNIRSNILD